jgi:hypothetical protein
MGKLKIEFALSNKENAFEIRLPNLILLTTSLIDQKKHIMKKVHRSSSHCTAVAIQSCNTEVKKRKPLPLWMDGNKRHHERTIK